MTTIRWFVGQERENDGERKNVFPIDCIRIITIVLSTRTKVLYNQKKIFILKNDYPIAS